VVNPFDSPEYDDHEHVAFLRDARAGLTAIVAIHSTVPMGVAGGGTRMWRYENADAALRDALRLSKAMSYKLALMGIPAGGAKAVILGDPARDKTEALLLAYGRAVHRLGGKFIAGEDVGTTPADMTVIARETPFVVSGEAGDADGAGATAHGVVVGMRVALERSGKSLRGARVLVQGVGRVGFALARELAAAGARLWVTDHDRLAVERAVREFGAAAVDPEAVFDGEVDVFAPCALGDVIDDASVDRLRCAVVCGSANNQLARDDLAERLASRGILHCPDFVVNAGGVVHAARAGAEAAGPFGNVFGDVDRIGTILRDAFARADREGITANAAAIAMAKEAIARFR
jgi:leucine dehydrogenase